MDNLPINIVDIGVGVVLLISAFLAYMRGFAHETLSVVGWVGAIFATLYGLPYVQPYAQMYIKNETLAAIAAGAAIFIVSLIILFIFTRSISSRIQASALNALDRSLGFLFGIVRGAVLICLVYLAVQWVYPIKEQPKWLTTAKTMPVIKFGAKELYALIPEETAKKGTKAAAQAKKKAEDAIRKQTEKTLQKMIAPKPQSADTKQPDGYQERQRRAMERLIDGSGK
ncbi:MAG: CvpA family protein [Rhodospirillaceae bacterium]|jgi:membrane protein required for colicin V production|nr:CvpA family protein [Rhodospirillales bacterium]MBT3906827.1 CvpA family protein [Rhodospirillaceae bacterium]MBT4701804.1 CvpA family protein [Rhodospirillaceae bacterium]MBT5035809.1 CvpA family protein [Rhodospirillaceae bacterium]MBT6221964.1 CvpA family protein [Rhodospirillaceae bacterium]